jgi:hypothetical protein
MEEKKRIAKGIKLNASQLPLTNKADFVVGKDSRKVLDNKIIENLSGGSHGYFPSTLSNDYRTWSVSRELEIPVLPDEAEPEMRMIEGASAAAPLQNEFGGMSHSTSEADYQSSDPFSHTASNQTGTPASDPELAAQLTDTYREILPGHRAHSGEEPPAAPAPPNAPSPWGAPTGDTQERYVVTNAVPESQGELSESPWAGPDMSAPVASPVSGFAQAQLPAPQQTTQKLPPVVPSEPHLSQPVQPAPQFVQQEPQPAQPDPQLAQPEPQPPEPHSSPTASSTVRSAQSANSSTDDADVLPDWMNALVFDATVSSELQAVEGSASSAAETPGKVELETFLSSIPDEEFVIDNETMRHLFSSLCEPKTTSKKIKSPASEAADIAIAAAAAEILKSEVSIDEISIEDLATQEMLTADGQTDLGSTESEAAAAAEFEAIQKAYQMLDLTPIPTSQRKDEFKSVYDVVENAAAGQTAAPVDSHSAGEQSSVSRTERGTIEMATHVGGRQLVPTYNFCGMLTGVAMSDGMSFVLSEEKNIWHMIEHSGKVMVSGIQSVSFDKQGNLSYVTRRGDVVTLKVDGSIDTRFAKKGQPSEISEAAIEKAESKSEELSPVQPANKAKSKSEDALSPKSADKEQSKSSDKSPPKSENKSQLKGAKSAAKSPPKPKPKKKKR